MSIITRAEFALNAPQVPQDFDRLKSQVVIDCGAGGGKRIVTRGETDLEQMVRWRLIYADAMIKALNK